MQKLKSLFVALALLLVVGTGCEESDSSEGLIGLWQCKETRSDNSYSVYNVSIDQFSTDSLYVIYNMYNLGMDFEVYVKLNRDSTFSFLGSNNTMYTLSGSGNYRPSLQKIEWEYSVSGQVNDPLVIATFEKN